MISELSQEFYFEAAHTLARTVPLAEYEPSRRIHGHTYLASVAIRGVKGDGSLTEYEKLNLRGKIERHPVDLFYVRKAIAQLRDKLDHRFLDEVEGLGPATLENLAAFIFAELAKKFPVVAVSVRRPASGDACTVSMEAV